MLSLSKVAAYASLVWLVLTGCQPTLPDKIEFPSASEAAVAAVNITDTALTAAMVAANPSIKELNDVWDPRVKVIDSAFVVVRMGEDVCSIVPGLTKVATDIGCAPCKKVIAAVCP